MTPAEPADLVPFRTLAHGDYSALDRSGLLMARAEAEWNELWSFLESGHSEPRAVPPVGWPSELAMVLALGMRPGGGYRVHIDRVTEQDGTLTVHAREIRPAATEFVTDALTQPFIAIATPACPGTVEHHITVAERG
ncbi:MAG TPA: protease complex subunit PrcB family protein [Streptosporangiaceae bacterium]|nr:protease complex subunit PrcB family protein [Streptosporangiaceae bacterium]